MWASSEGGAPEVTLETSMGSFTVEVHFNLSLSISIVPLVPFLLSLLIQTNFFFPLIIGC